MRNSIRKAIGRVWSQLFDSWWDFYYESASCVPPFKHFRCEFNTIEEDRKIYGTFRDPVCFPLPFKLNCFGCMGCSSVKNPPLHPDKPKGPYKVFFHPIFLEQWEEKFGKQSTFDLVWDMEQKNIEVDKIKSLHNKDNIQGE